ncbi:hypothetical protein [Flavobacterium sp. KACC 22761]|uniref:hypothetical protein n=1 Tax=Flavobacterium sp. KACC 22761 TaxID=3092665 RepID=UPI002A755502|nr:hypothetical protein [Flavobacterium sp. KACC 22761]WPO78205.1 hypothetical protein SCB73_18230 [Flavobacterium sp. KACC 22761]
MDKVLEKVFDFFENKAIHFGLRSSLFIISIFVVTFCDYYFDFSYDYHLSNKIEKLESIDRLKKIYKNDNQKITELTELENRIYKRRHYSDRLRSLDINQLNLFKKSDKTAIKSVVNKNDNITIENNVRSLFWMVLTSNYFFIILIIGLIIMPFTGSVHRELKNVLGSIAAIIIIIGIIYIITWVAYKIPLLWNRPYLNYILNSLIQSPFIYLIFLWNKAEKK